MACTKTMNTAEHPGTPRNTSSVKQNNTVKFGVPGCSGVFRGVPVFLILLHARRD